MRTTIRAEYASMLQVDDWFAGLRGGGSAEPGRPGKAEPAGPGPGGPGYAVPASYGHDVSASPGRAEPAGHVRAVPAEPGYAVPVGYGWAGPAASGARPQAPTGPVAPSACAAAAAPARTAAPAVPARPVARTTPAGPAGAAVRAVIGDQLRMPVMRCEMGSCRSRHADPAALGEADARARAIAAGWRIDAVGRLACPRCQQRDPGSWAARPVAAPDRDMALASTAPLPAVPGDSTARGAALRLSRDLRRAGRGYSLARRTKPERHPDYPTGETHAPGQVSRKPGRYLQSLGVVLNPARARRANGGRQAAPSHDSRHSEYSQEPMIREPAGACSAL